MRPGRLACSKLACLRGQRLLFRDLSFEVKAGEALIIEGPNGAGKTSLLRLLAGFIAPTFGVIELYGSFGMIDEPEERGKYIGWFGHHDGLKAQLSLWENLRFHSHIYGGAADYEAALEWAGLSRAADLPAHYLSAGQKKRLALARLKLSNRPLWLLDEPLAALDQSAKRAVEQLIQDHRAAGGMVIAATHEPLAGQARHLVLT